jgi:hypothetical protein
MPAAPVVPVTPAARPWRIALLVLVAVMLAWDGFKVATRPSAETLGDLAFHAGMLVMVGAAWRVERQPEGSARRRRWMTTAVLGALTTLTVLGWRLFG